MIDLTKLAAASKRADAYYHGITNTSGYIRECMALHEVVRALLIEHEAPAAAPVEKGEA